MTEIKTVDTVDIDERHDDRPSGSDQDKTNEKSGSSHRNRAVLERYINPAAIANFGFTLLCSWEALGLSFQYTLLNGGPASLVYGPIFAGLGSLAIATSLAEMASIDPVVGAQYRWSAAFAPSNPEFWGLFQGWITVFGWCFSCAANPVYIANTVQSLIVFNYETYKPERWHATLMMWGFIIIPVVWNFYFRKMLNTMEMIGGICHVVFFIISIVTLAVLAPRSNSEYVWNTLTTDLSGWTNPAAAWSLGVVNVAFPMSSFDGVLHMSDEVKGPRTKVPQSMIMAVGANALMQFAFMVCLLYTIGDVTRVSEASHKLPIIEVYYQATKNKHATNLLTIMMALILYVSLFNILASVSRLVWTFARDNGFPFSEFFSYVHPTLRIPLNALLLVGGICCLLALVNIGSSVALAAAISLPLVALYISYAIPILFILIRKLQGRHPQYGPFKLGRWGIPINLSALLYILYMLPFGALPTVRPVTAEFMNYSGPLVLAVIILALGDWCITGRKRFRVPTAPELREDE